MILFRRVTLPAGAKTLVWIFGLLIALLLDAAKVYKAGVWWCVFPATAVYVLVKWLCEGSPSLHIDALETAHKEWEIDWNDMYRSPFMPPKKIVHRFIINRHYVGDFELKFRYKFIAGLVAAGLTTGAYALLHH